MKKFSILPVIILVTCILPGGWAVAQLTTTQSLTSPDCFTSYLKRGNSYILTKSYDLAIQQFKAAKYCKNLRPDQKKTLDSLIEDAGRKIQSNKKGTILQKF
jgi:hypothetical protein